MRRQVDLLLELLKELQSLPRAEGDGNPLDRQGHQRVPIRSTERARHVSNACERAQKKFTWLTFTSFLVAIVNAP